MFRRGNHAKKKYACAQFFFIFRPIKSHPQMDSTELGCIIAGTLAIGLISSQVRRDKTRNRRMSMPLSVCSGMRSKVQSLFRGTTRDEPRVSAKAAQTLSSDDEKEKTVMTDSMASLFEVDNENKEAFENQLGKEGQRIASRQVRPEYDKTRAGNRYAFNSDIGEFFQATDR